MKRRTPAHDTLPGVERAPARPRVVFHSADVVKRARRFAAARDALQLALLIAVDWMFVVYPATHVPFMNRPQSAGLLAGVNAAIICAMVAARWMPRLRTKRIASTWCDEEKRRFRT